MKKRSTRLLLVALLAVVGALAVSVSVAMAFDSGGNPGVTGPNTITWTHQGTVVVDGTRVLDPTKVECPGTGVPDGIDENSYLHWIFTTNGGSATATPGVTPTLALGGTGSGSYPYSSANSGGSTFHFYTPFFDPDGLTAQAAFNTVSTGSGAWNLVISHGCGGIPPADDPTVSKDAEGAYDETFVWTPDKKADVDTVYSAGGGESGEVNYTVSVSHDEGTVSNVKVSGTITVTNPNDGAIELDSVTDALSDDTDCTVDVGDPADYTIPANGTKDYDYECKLDGLPEGDLTNKVTIAWSDQTLSDGSELEAGTADFPTETIVFTATQVDECVTVDDTNPAGPQDVEVCVGDDNPTEFEYSATFSDDAVGTCTEHENVASIETKDTGTEDSASKTVEDCQGADLTVEKTATPSFTRAYDWDISKEVEQDALGSTTFDYAVSVSHDVGIDSEWKVIGTITVTNPNDWQDVTLDSLTDTIDNGGTCAVDDTAGLTIPMGDSVEYPYECTYASAPDPADFTNTATATWNAATYHTPSGSDDGTAEDAFGDPTTEIDECIDVVDDNGTPANLLDDVKLGTVCVGDDNPTEFEYSKTLDVGDAKCVTYTNTASYSTSDDENDTDEVDSASQTVEYCRPATIGYWKTHMYQCAPRERSGANGCSNNGPFTAAFLPQSLGNYVVDTTAKALAVFNANNCSNAASSDNNASACLAAQLLGAKLNVANNGPSCIAATIAAADSFLINNVSPSYNGPTGGPYTLDTRAQAIAYKTALDNYNKGLGCPI